MLLEEKIMQAKNLLIKNSLVTEEIILHFNSICSSFNDVKISNKLIPLNIFIKDTQKHDIATAKVILSAFPSNYALSHVFYDNEQYTPITKECLLSLLNTIEETIKNTTFSDFSGYKLVFPRRNDKRNERIPFSTFLTSEPIATSNNGSLIILDGIFELEPLNNKTLKEIHKEFPWLEGYVQHQIEDLSSIFDSVVEILIQEKTIQVDINAAIPSISTDMYNKIQSTIEKSLTLI